MCYHRVRIFFFYLAQQPPPPVGQGLLIHEVSRSHSTTHHSWQESSGRVISSSQRPLPDSTQHSQVTDIHAPGVIWTHSLSRRAAPDLHLRPRCFWDRPKNLSTYYIDLVFQGAPEGCGGVVDLWNGTGEYLKFHKGRFYNANSSQSTLLGYLDKQGWRWQGM